MGAVGPGGRPGSAVENSEFGDCALVGAPAGTTVMMAGFIGDPLGPGARWGGVPYDPARMRSTIDGWGRMNTFMSVAIVKRGPDGQYHRTKECFVRLIALVADDVQAESLPGSPSWVLHTSPGKTQVGVWLDPTDDDCADLDLVVALMKAMAAQNLVELDKAGNNPVRWVRMPCGQNQKPRESGHHDHYMSTWAPSVRLPLADAAAVFGIDLDAVKAQLASAPRDAGGQRAIGPVEFQDDKVRRLVQAILDGSPLHDSLRDLAASLIASGTLGGTVTTVVQTLMENSHAQRSRPQEWQSRYRDIGRLVADAERKFKRGPATIDAETGEVIEPERANRFKSWGELRDKQVRIDWLAKLYFELNAIVLIFGASGSGKSFIAIHLACCTATGMPFFNQPVKQGPVFLILGEGEQGIIRRIRAWERHYGKQIPDNMLFLSERGAELSESGDALAVSAEVAEMAKVAGAQPVLVVIDTLHANFGPGDENSAQDMGLFLGNVKRHIRLPYRCTVAIVHHSGHEQERARGSSALRAALDQEYRVEARGADRLTLTCTKMKDSEPPKPLDLKLVTGIELGQDEDGEPVLGAAVTFDGNPFERVLVTGKDEADKPRPVRAIDLLEYLRLKGWQSQVALCSTFKLSTSSAEKLMRLAVEQKLVRRLGHNKGYEIDEEAAQQASLYSFEVLAKDTEAREKRAREEGEA